MPRTRDGSEPTHADVYRHEDAQRLNNPEAGLAIYETDEPPKAKFRHRMTTEQPGDPRMPPQLLWAGKSGTGDVDVDAVSIHVHERLSAEAIARTVQKDQSVQLTLDLFADPQLDRKKELELDRYGLRTDPDLGVFVGVPSRNQLDLHVAADARAIPSLNMLAAFTAAGYRDAAGVLSPNVYWWRPSGLRRISTLTPDGPRIEVDAELQTVLETLARR